MSISFGKIYDRVQVGLSFINQRIEAMNEKTLLLVLLLFYWVWRIMTLPMFEFSGDAAWKWRFLRYFSETGTWITTIPDHHQGRWAQNIPVYWLMKTFHTSSPWISPIVPMCSGFILLLLVWKITREIASKTMATLAFLCTMTCFVFVNESAQFLPSLPCAMYTLLALYLLMKYLDNPAKLYLPLLSGVLLGLAWGCKVTAAYWCVGIGLFLIFFKINGKDMICTKNFRIGWDVILLALGFLMILIPETVLINKFFKVELGRISMLHVHNSDNPNLVCYNLVEYILSPIMFFVKFSGKAVDTIPKAMLFLLVLPVVIMQLRNKNLPLKHRLLLFSLTIATIIHCYFVIKIFPFKHPERPLSRYFLTLTCVSFIVLFSGWRIIPEFFEKSKKYIMSIYGVLFAVMIFFAIGGLIKDPIMNNDNLFSKIYATKCIKLQREQNLPLLVRYHNGKKFTNRTGKVIILWKTFLAPTDEIKHIQFDEAEELKKKWELTPAVVTEDNEHFFHLQGATPQVGKSELCVIVDETEVYLKELKIKNQEK